MDEPPESTHALVPAGEAADAEALARERLLLEQLEPPKPWEQQPEEPGNKFLAFCIYRDMGPARTLREAGRRWMPLTFSSSKHVQNGKDGRGQNQGSLVATWARQFNWAIRARAWDMEMDRQRREAQVRAVQEMNAAQARLAQIALEKLREAVESINPARITARDMPAWIVAMTKVQRIAMGEAAEMVEQRTVGPEGGPLQFEHLVNASDDDLDARLRELVRAGGDELRQALRDLPDPLPDGAGRTARPGGGEEGEDAPLEAEYHPAGGG